LISVVFFRVRYGGWQNVPLGGGGLVCSNHQSNLDPPLVGMCFNCRLNYLARDTLFGFKPFRWLIRSLDAIPIDREGLGLSGLKETLRRLKRGELVLLFPEGTRTTDGEVGPFKPGFCAVARRAKVPLIPVGMHGAFDAWPRRRKLPRPATIHIYIGQPITPEQAAAMSDDELVALLHQRICDCKERARTRRF